MGCPQDKLLDAAHADTRRACITNPHYSGLAAVASCLSVAVTAAKPLGLWPKEFAEQCTDLVFRANRTVALTFALFHICVEFPKLRGQRNQLEAAKALKTRICSSEFEESWSSLPKCISACIDAFGK